MWLVRVAGEHRDGRYSPRLRARLSACARVEPCYSRPGFVRQAWTGAGRKLFRASAISARTGAPEITMSTMVSEVWM